MRTEEFSISLPSNLVLFITEYQLVHACKNQSEVIKEAIELLRTKELERHYSAANNEIDPAFDCTAADGLDS